jgi:hypothetical protein
VVYHERLSDSRRLSTRLGYGYGIGAVCAIHLRRGDVFAISMLGDWTRTMVRQMVKAVAARDAFGVRQRWGNVVGTAAGLWYGLRAGGSRPSE